MSLADCPLPTPEATTTIAAPSRRPTATQRFGFEFDLDLRHAGRRRVRIAVESQGPVDAPVVWVAGGISAHRHVASNVLDPQAGWWQDAVGAGRALDPTRHCLIACDWLGAGGDLDVPLDTRDQAAAIVRILDELGIARLEAFVGASYGAMVGLALAADHPARLKRLVALSGAHRPDPFASAYRALQRQLVRFARERGAEAEGLALARQFAMLSYRTQREFGQRFDAPVLLAGGSARCAAEDYLAECGARYVARWNATAFLRLSESIDLHAVDPAAVRTPTWLLAVEDDWLAPPPLVDTLAAGIAAPVSNQRIASPYGHDAFLKETVVIDAWLREALQSPLQGARA
ncbi:MAG TPA: homoserine O-succinyltransferase [Pseudomonadota bacterium]|nr:homoserine O-succinyltransferase [Pseudomonadota bacterium]